MTREATAAALGEQIAAFIVAGQPDDTEFDRLARAVFAYQYQYNAPYRRFCDGKGRTPNNLTSWQEIPPAPAATFKHFALTCAPEADCTPERGGRVFHSSGTTASETSHHFPGRRRIDLYRVSLKSGYERFLPVKTSRIIALMPPPVEAPHSSLSFMLAELSADFRFRPERWIGDLAEELPELEEPCTLFGTAFAWVHFFDATEKEWFVLPGGSVVLETGGFKGRSREVSRDDLYALFTNRLGAGASHCVSEYGMSEMASQFYDSTLIDALAGRDRPLRKVAPYWLKTRVMDPVTGQEATPGQPGILAHYDLANLNSVLALQTEDYGHTAEDGEGIVLLGRAPGAVLRGCSLTAEEMMTAASDTAPEAAG